MRLVRALGAWASDRRGLLLSWVVGTGLALGVLALAPRSADGGWRGEDLGYAALLWLGATLVGLGFDLHAHFGLVQVLRDGRAEDPGKPEARATFVQTRQAWEEERRLALDERRKAERLRDDDHAALIHEAKTPLAVLQLALDDQDDRFFDTLRTELARLEVILEKGLFTSRAESFASDYLLEETGLRTLVGGTAARFAPGLMGRSIGFRMEPFSHRVLTDPKWLGFILAQFFSNALKYLPPGATVTVSCQREDRSTVLAFVDDGPGIPEEDLPRLWDRGYTGRAHRSTGSTGMGLYLAARLAERLGHRVEAANGAGGGARFSVQFFDHPDQPYGKVSQAARAERSIDG